MSDATAAPAPPWSSDTCIGALPIQWPAASTGHQIIRNRGWGGDSYAAPARLTADGIDFKLLPRTSSSQNGRTSARVYFGASHDSCTEGAYSPTNYMAVDFIGKTLSWDVNISASRCGCNAALYLVNMRQNSEPGECAAPGEGADHYCDANLVCGVDCAEIDLMEANNHAFHSVLHKPGDSNGRGGGIGGGKYDLTRAQYRPGGGVIDTLRPFRVHSWFRRSGATGGFHSLQTTMVQDGRSATFTVHRPDYEAAMTTALTAGMTLVGSFWSAKKMAWLSGGMCQEDQDACGDFVSYTRFAVCEGGPTCEFSAPTPPLTPPLPPPLPPAPSPSSPTPLWPPCPGPPTTCVLSPEQGLQHCTCRYTWPDAQGTARCPVLTLRCALRSY